MHPGEAFHGDLGMVAPGDVFLGLSNSGETEEILRLARGEYVDYNDTHFTEELAERHGITVSSPTVRRLRRVNGLASPRKRRPPRHRVRSFSWMPSQSKAAQ